MLISKNDNTSVETSSAQTEETYSLVLTQRELGALMELASPLDEALCSGNDVSEFTNILAVYLDASPTMSKKACDITRNYLVINQSLSMNYHYLSSVVNKVEHLQSMHNI